MSELNLTIESKLNDSWVLWKHQSKNDWSLNGFIKLYTIETIEDFWVLNNSWEVNGGIHLNRYFLMKNYIKPIWEDNENKNGGCWSFKIKENQSQELWDDLASYLVSGNLLDNYEELNGISLTKKKNSWVVLKIWNKNNRNSSLKNINYNILKKWGLDVIYISHLT